MKNISISIGIAAYNEEYRIKHVLSGLLAQREIGWNLKEIFVFCDGCTDKTAHEARRIKDRRIRIVEDQIRKGKTARLQQMFRACSGELLVMFDADVELVGKHVVTKLIAPFVTEKQVMLVGGNSRPHPPKTFTERAVSSTFEVFDRSRNEIRGGDNIFCCTGSILAIRQSFAKSVEFPNIVCEDAYLYLLCIRRGYLFRYVDDAVVFYQLPKRVSDYIRQVFRSSPEGVSAELTPYFGSLVNQEFHRPLAFYARAALSAFWKNPLGTALIVFINITNMIVKPLYPFIWKKYDLRWFTAASTHE